MVGGQISFLEVMISIINNDMAIRTANSERVYRDSAKAVLGPRRWLKRELKPPFCCRNLRVDFFEVDVRWNEPILENQNRFDDAD